MKATDPNFYTGHPHGFPSLPQALISSILPTSASTSKSSLATEHRSNPDKYTKHNSTKTSKTKSRRFRLHSLRALVSKPNHPVSESPEPQTTVTQHNQSELRIELFCRS